jgi:hypothetical protein
VTVRNIDERRVTAITFLVALDRPGLAKVDSTGVSGASLTMSSPLPVSLEPGAAAEIEANLMRVDEARSMRRTLRGPAQPMLGVIDVMFDDGKHWRMLPLESGRTAGESLSHSTGVGATLDDCHSGPERIARPHVP